LITLSKGVDVASSRFEKLDSGMVMKNHTNEQALR
jgi:hypothetical protein